MRCLTKVRGSAMPVPRNMDIPGSIFSRMLSALTTRRIQSGSLFFDCLKFLKIIPSISIISISNTHDGIPSHRGMKAKLDVYNMQTHPHLDPPLKGRVSCDFSRSSHAFQVTSALPLGKLLSHPGQDTAGWDTSE